MSGLTFRSPATLALRGGDDPRKRGPIVPPLHQVSSHARPSLHASQDHSYSRVSNASVSALEARLAALEGVPFALATTSGMAALSTLAFALLKPGDHILCSRSCYGGTARFLDRFLHPLGIETSYVAGADLDAVSAALRPSTKFLFVESPGNPTLEVADLAGLGVLAREHGALLAVDNTFLTPVLQRPFALGADLVLYSTTKFIEGHNAALGGALLCTDASLHERLAFTRKTLGTIQSPFDAWLTLQGLKTLPLRIEAQSRAALRLARWLEQRPEVERVLYPFLDSFRNSHLAREQQASGGGVLSFVLRGGRSAAEAFTAALRLVLLAENLGAVESLVTHPASMTHADLGPERRLELGIDEGLLRLSVGLEDPNDLIADLERGLLALNSKETLA